MFRCVEIDVVRGRGIYKNGDSYIEAHYEPPSNIFIDKISNEKIGLEVNQDNL